MENEFWTLRAATTAFTYVLAAGFLALFGIVVAKIATNRIDIGTVILEKDTTNKASIARFQLLVFTLVIAGLYVVLSLENGSLVDVPTGALALLGISGGSYLVSKGIGSPSTRLAVAQAKAAQADLPAQAPPPDRP